VENCRCCGRAAGRPFSSRRHGGYAGRFSFFSERFVRTIERTGADDMPLMVTSKVKRRPSMNSNSVIFIAASFQTPRNHRQAHIVEMTSCPGVGPQSRTLIESPVRKQATRSPALAALVPRPRECQGRIRATSDSSERTSKCTQPARKSRWRKRKPAPHVDRIHRKSVFE